jgi:hypothetical protein
MRVSGQNALRCFEKSWPIIPGLADPERPIAQVDALGHWERILALFANVHQTTVGFPADPLINGNFEGAAGPAGWSNFNCTISRVAGSRTGGPGSYVGQMVFSTSALGLLYQACSTIGNWYRDTGWMRSDGVATPTLASGGGTVYWTGAASNSWQYYDVTYQATAANLCQQCSNLLAGRWCQWDDATHTPLNASQLTDLSGAGHHLVQATAAKRPLWVPSGSGGVLRFDGVADFMKAVAFTLDQPEHVFFTGKHQIPAGLTGYMVDGDALNTMAIIAPVGGGTPIYTYAGGNGAAVAAPPNTAEIIDAVFDGANSRNGVNGGASVSGPIAASPSGSGVTIGSAGNGLGAFIGSDATASHVFYRALSDSERQNFISALIRTAWRNGMFV